MPEGVGNTFGFLTATRETSGFPAASDGGPPRKYYRPSSAGRLALGLGVSEWRAARDAVDAVLAPVKVEVA